MYGNISYLHMYCFLGIPVLVLLYFNHDRIVNIFDHSSKNGQMVG